MDFEERCWKAEALLERYKKTLEKIAAADIWWTLKDSKYEAKSALEQTQE